MNAETTPSESPVIWVLSTGTEILQGHYADTNAQWLSRRLLELGFSTARHVAVPDHDRPLREALGEAAARADLIIISGGLGPTVDDRNRDIIAETWAMELVENTEALERITERYRLRGRMMTPNNHRQALIPRGAIILQNDHGTAPGFFIPPGQGAPRPGAALLALPGPPRELAPMFEEKGVPCILRDFGAGRPPRRILSFHTIGIAESLVGQRIEDLFDADPQVNLALLASLGKVDVRLTLMGETEDRNVELESRWREMITERLGAGNIYGEGGTAPEEILGRLLRERGQTLAVAESCTGGAIAACLTDVAGSSDYFREGFVTYADSAKQRQLGVSAELLARHGAVSGEVAEAMAAGARREAGTDWGLSVTGIAGPGGGSAEKPVGLVYFGLVDPRGPVLSQRQRFVGDREGIRRQARLTALEILRRALLGLPLEVRLPEHAIKS